MAAYRSKELKHHPGKVSFWWNGVQVGLISEEEERDYDFDKSIARWEKEYGHSFLYRERISLPVPQLAALSLYQPSQANFNPLNFHQPMHHKMKVLVQLPGSTITLCVEVFDDTGSSYLDLFWDDCYGLGMDPLTLLRNYQYDFIDLNAANGLIRRPLIPVTLQFVAADDTLIGQPIHTSACLCLDVHSWERPRCSGSSLRRSLFTATAPGDLGNGTLIVAPPPLPCRRTESRES
ncbi:hypothetical protein ASPZODRAFT_2059193 [Penicilliopsis zonata CBS 506.65]|uniref:Uncharacterized protein n=1 Tax=Penicilliopsis zonata CBS 506.65 TaxID=1073090 RepID=A0A1L9SG28_9EURO|nr:hypothetical protein ASPZODRAFT_2059193 [Penicilliopsis zonata CBS 506.65]OJJ46122.1 hypothetical protein ASPZODRAFT_2059193 [Penicilliopsis zonata CBS 506.65]